MAVTASFARSACALLAAVTLDCTSDSQRSERTVEVTLTSGDRTKLLYREPDIHFADSLPNAIATIDVDTTRRFQMVVGFGAALSDASAWLIQHKLTPAQRDSLLQEIFGHEPGIAFSFVRIDMGASDFSLRHYSYDDVAAGGFDSTLANFSIAPDRAETLPILKRALTINPRLTVMASPWSAPAWMKSSASLIKGTLRPESYPLYAEYFRKFIEAYAAEGVPIHLISLQNEPHFEPENYPGMRLNPAQRALLVRDHFGPLFARARIRTQILDWDHNWDEPNSPLEVLADSGARRFIAGVAWHCYGGDVSAQSVVHDKYPEKDVYFTECSGGEWAPRFADNLVWNVRTLIIGATRNWARGVLMRNLALDEKHGPHTGGCGDCRGVVTISSTDGSVVRNEEYYAFAHASRFVRPGAQRVWSSSGIEGIESVAFQNADDRSVALIVVNANTQETTFAVRIAGRTFTYTLPGGAVATFRWS